MGMTRVAGVVVAVVVVVGGCGGGGGDGDDEWREGERRAVVKGGIFDRKSTEERDDDEPLVGVVISVTDADGDDVGESTTDDQGYWSVPVPEPGSYTATLDVETLPDGVEVEDDTLEVEVAHERDQPVAPFHVNEP